MLVEICANSYESALAAQTAGAHRIELCSELALGGITPSHGLIQKVMERLTIPVFVLIRARSGDFSYATDEMDVMLRDIAFCAENGVQGIVSGALNVDMTVDCEATRELVAASQHMAFTYHRAFDWTSDAEKALERLKELGVQRVLSSGHSPNAIGGFENLKSLLALADNQIGILPGGGISETNAQLFQKAGFSEIHASLSSYRDSQKGVVSMFDTSNLEQHRLSYSDTERIRKLLDTLSR